MSTEWLAVVPGTAYESCPNGFLIQPQAMDVLEALGHGPYSCILVQYGTGLIHGVGELLSQVSKVTVSALLDCSYVFFVSLWWEEGVTCCRIPVCKRNLQGMITLSVG